ncbi:hypothetical protein L3X38_033380 [Prunus dulcis]|uniref:Uncharacterized protein n=1 Tax=Prunus dulcis TaxID=3755 RepID=A0AAD4YVU5_PRUDU|nr:hypothetical protein L3X38_033380 [Prunus dulcis]
MVAKRKQKQRIILPPELPPEVSEDKIEFSDEDRSFVDQNREYAGFLSTLDTQSITNFDFNVVDAQNGPANIESNLVMRYVESSAGKRAEALGEIGWEVKVGGLHKVSMWDFVQVVVVATRVLEIRFGNWGLLDIFVHCFNLAIGLRMGWGGEAKTDLEVRTELFEFGTVKLHAIVSDDGVGDAEATYDIFPYKGFDAGRSDGC